MKTKEIDVDAALVQKAVQALWKVHESTQKTNTLLPEVSKLEVRFGLVKAPGRGQRKLRRIPIPHGLHGDVDDLEVCLIVKEEAKPKVQDIIAKAGDSLKFVKKVLGLQSLRNKHAEFQQRRELFKRYDVFLADDRILPMLTKALGKQFIHSKKIPIPVRVTRETSMPFAIIDAIQSSTYMNIPEGTCINIIAGKTAQTIHDMVDNVLAICKHAAPQCPKGGIANVQSIMLKLPHSVALPIYNKTPAEIEELAKLAGLPSPHKATWASKQENSSNENDDDEENSDGQSSKRKQPPEQLKSPLLKALKKQRKMKEQNKNQDDMETDVKVSKKEISTETKTESNKSKSMITTDKSSEATAKLQTQNIDTVHEKEEKSKTEKKKRSKSPDRTKGTATNKHEDDGKEKDIQKTGKAADEEDKVENEKSTKRQKKGTTVDETPKSKSESNKAETSKPEKAATKDYIPSSKYAGSKHGYVFKKDSKGLGYYRDVPPVVDKMAMEAFARMAKGAGKATSASSKRRSSSSFKGKQQQHQQQQRRHRRASR